MVGSMAALKGLPGAEGWAERWVASMAGERDFYWVVCLAEVSTVGLVEQTDKRTVCQKAS